MPRVSKEKNALYHKRWYSKNAPKRRLQVLARKKANRDWFQEMKKSLKCQLCPEAHPACLEFHHRDRTTKGATVGILAGRGGSRNRVLLEISKCDVLCANCHRKLHYPILLPNGVT